MALNEVLSFLSAMFEDFMRWQLSLKAGVITLHSEKLF